MHLKTKLWPVYIELWTDIFLGLIVARFKTLHEKQHFRKNAQRKYHILLIFRN